ncbi:hypothetical protein HDZ31DRAFT_68503, partial [Schizophyllum fasciatum]
MSSFRDTFGGQNDLPGFSAEHDSFDVMPTPTTSTPNDAFLPESEETSFKSMTWPQAGGLGHPYRLPYNDGAYPAGDQRRENTMAFFATQAPHAYGSAASELAGSSGFLPDGDAYHRHALARGPCDALNAPQPAVSPFAPWHLHNPTFESSFLSTEAPNIFARNSFASAIATASQGWGSYAYGKGGFGGVTAPEAAIRDGGVSSSGRVLTGDRPRDHVGGDTYGESLSSHEKKRYYLESLEQYVIYLHEQLKLVGTDPVPLERVSTYRGLSSRSIRTLLVHMRNGVGKLSLRTESEEKK